ncbi:MULTISPECIES: UrcA family protein [unclassified Sphingobium]|uniref:UrcA family protein n=1 Tax=unclassified Sphingobium TaxID=2611147 RepID=UPI0035A6D723
MSRKTLAVLTASLALALPGMASAGSNSMDVIVDGNSGAQTRSVVVPVNDLNLASASGMRRADYRLIRASKEVCGYVRGSILPVTEDYRTCYGNAIEGARSDLNSLAQRQG